MADLASTISDQPISAVLRTGRVTNLGSSSEVTVDVGGGEQVDMPALTGYEPIPGDVVQILQQGAVQLVLGRTSPLSGDNALNNPSFELDQPGVAPTSWTKVVDPGFPTGDAVVKTDTATGWGPVSGRQWLELDQTTLALAQIHVLSEAIPVSAGQLWTAAAYAANLSTDPDGGQCYISLTWYADDTSVWPSTVAGDTVISIISFPQGGIPGWTLLRQLIGVGFRVPTGATWMRVRLTTILKGGVGSAAYWDGIICRLIRT